jgi:hypothetical protein
MISAVEIERTARERAAGRCEYCRMHQSLQGATFHLEHIVPLSKGGRTELSNLAIACPGCNLAKSDRISARDPVTGKSSPLYHPRDDRWASHFRFNSTELVGLTVVGRTTIAAFGLNHPRRRRIREAEQMFGQFPPTE